MLRLRFSTDDLMRIRIVARPDPMWELVLSIHRLHGRQPASTAHDDWVQRIPSINDPPSRAWDVLSLLIPAKGNFPDFLTPTRARSGFEAGIDAIRATPSDRLRTEVSTALDQHSATSQWASELTKADRSARLLLDLALRDHFRRFVRPHWPEIQRHVAADFALRSRHVASGGTDALLAGMPAGIRWRWPILEADYPRDHEIDLCGRGLVLIPSFFCVGSPVTLIDPYLPPVLVYPVTQAAAERPKVSSRCPHPDQIAALEDVVGATRAQILAALDEPCSTTELANRIGRSVASASQQVGLLRSAGLVRTTRRGQHVEHELSGTGWRLLGTPEHLAPTMPEQVRAPAERKGPSPAG